MAKKDKPVFYYDDELNNDFAGTNISKKEVDESFRFIRTSPLWKACAFFLYYIFAWPLVWFFMRVILGVRFVNKKAVKECGDYYFLYGNHTGFIDAFTPNLISLPRRNRIIVGPDTVSIPFIQNIVQMMGAIPLPTKISGMRKFYDAVEHYHKSSNITIFPEAHIWPYYTGVRPFTDASFAYPVQMQAPVIAFFVAYTKPTGIFAALKKANRTVYVSDPIYPAEGLSAIEAKKDLRDKVYTFMLEKSKFSDYEVIQYIKREKKPIE